MIARSRRAVLSHLFGGLVTLPFVADARSESVDGQEAVWQHVVAGDFAAAIKILDTRLAEVKLDKEARFARARLSYATANYMSASEDFQLLLRRRPDWSPGNFSVSKFVPEIRSVEAWVYFCDGKLGRSSELPAVGPDPITALLRGDISKDEYIRANIAVWQDVIDTANRDAGESTDGAPVIIKFIPPDGLADGFSSMADFALAQQALIKKDVASARDLLMSAVRIEADNAIDFHIAKHQLSELK